jgi:RND family efflux transporter MFP subunit
MSFKSSEAELRPDTLPVNSNGVAHEPPSVDGSRQQKSPGTKWIAIVVLAVLVLLGIFWKLRSNSNAKNAGAKRAAPPTPTVRVVPVSVGNVASTLFVTGTLRTNQDVNLSSKIPGRIAKVYVREGDRITRGQLLIALETDDLRAQVENARANLKTAQVRRLQASTGLPGRVQQVLSAIEQAEANYNSAQARYRQAVLQEPARVQQVLNAIDQAQANYESARARLRQAQLNEPVQLQQAQGQVTTAEETVRTAQARLSQAKTTAQQTELQTNAEIAAAQSLVEQRQAALAEVRRGSRAQQIAQAQAQVNVAQANLKNAQNELNRQRILFEGGAAPKASLDTAQTNYDVSKAQLEQAQQNLSLVQEGATNEQIRQAEEAVQQAQAQLVQAQAGRGQITVAQSEVTAAVAAVTQAQAGLRTAQANLGQIPISRQETRVAQEAVSQARAALQSAQADSAQIPVTRQATRIAKQDVEVARANLAQAQANRSQIPVARQDVLAADAGVQAANAQLQQQLVSLKNARIYSPVNGVVNTKQADVGESVTSGTTLLNLVALDSVYFEGQVSENNVRLIAPNQPVIVNVPAVSAQPLHGNVTEIIPVADPKSRQFRVRITIPNPDHKLTPGAFARANVTTQAVYNALTVPTETILHENHQAFVFIAVGEGKTAVVDRRIVKTGLEATGKTQILGGLERGDQVIIGNHELSDGDKVQTVSGD